MHIEHGIPLFERHLSQGLLSSHECRRCERPHPTGRLASGSHRRAPLDSSTVPSNVEGTPPRASDLVERFQAPASLRPVLFTATTPPAAAMQAGEGF